MSGLSLVPKPELGNKKIAVTLVPKLQLGNADPRSSASPGSAVIANP